MKKVFPLVISFLVLCISVNAQKITTGSLDCLKEESKVNMICIFDECTIDGKPAIVKIREEEKWEEGVKDVIKRFRNGVWKFYPKIEFGCFSDTKYTLVYKLRDIDDDEDIKGEMQLIDTKSKEVIATIEKANANGGSFGSFFNLVGDSFENLGKKIGKLLSR